MTPTETQTDAFYRSAALGIAWLDAREATPRRLGAAADAAWRSYAGHPSALTDLDRVELLLRDAATLHPFAFGPRAVFDLGGLTEDEPFGPWTHTPAPGIARDILRSASPKDASIRSLLVGAAHLWATPVDPPGSLPSIGPTTRVLCVGVGALVALAEHFERNRALDIAEQVVVASDSPVVRQLAGLAGMALGARMAPRVLPSSSAVGDLRATGIVRLDTLVASDDATTAERAAADDWLRALGR